MSSSGVILKESIRKKIVPRIADELKKATYARYSKEKLVEKIINQDTKEMKATSSTVDAESDIDHTELDDFDDLTLDTLKKLEQKGYKIIYPNLKYRKPKYKDTGDILKYIESDGPGTGGVKLVIMNFND